MNVHRYLSVHRSAAPLRIALFVLLSTAAVGAHAYTPGWSPNPVLEESFNATGEPLIADFDGDGRPDVVSRSLRNTVHLFRLGTERQFLESTVVHTGTQLSGVLSSDVGNDGKADLIVSDFSTKALLVLRGRGDGTFEAPIVTTTVAPTSISSADFNHDGIVDVVVRSSTEAKVAIYIGDGVGNFTAGPVIATSAEFNVLVAGDVDADGKDDLVIRNTASWSFYFGKGDGTFDSPMTIAGASGSNYQLRLADIDGDTDNDLLALEYNSRSVGILRNDGSRQFTASSPVVAGPITLGQPNWLLVKDVTADGVADMVIPGSGRRAVTHEGRGDGTFRPYVMTHMPAFWGSGMTAVSLAVADFTGDGKPDLVVPGSGTGLALMTNVAGELVIELYAKNPTISTDGTASLGVSLGQVGEAYDDRVVINEGTVVILEGTTVRGTATVQNRTQTVTVSGLAAGVHTLTAVYQEDLRFHTATSASVSQNVVTEKSTMTLTADKNGQVVWGETWMLNATITSPISDPGTGGSSTLFVDGVAVSPSGPPWFGTQLALPVGTHTLYAKYPGSSTRPACTSNTITVTVRKGSTITTIVRASVPEIIRYGERPTISAGVTTIEGVPDGPVGSVRWYEVASLLGTSQTASQCCPLKGSTTFQLPLLPVGLHYIDADFAGSAYYEASSLAGPVRVIVTPAEGFVIDASAGDTNVRVLGNRPPAPGRSFTLYRRVNRGEWQVAGQSLPTAIFTDVLPGYDYVHQYRMEMYDSGVLSAASNIDVVASVLPYDTTPPRGTRNMIVHAEHLRELLISINHMRQLAGLQAGTLEGVAPGQYIRASHFVRLRELLNEARAAFGATPVAAGPAVSVVIAASHLEAIREGIN